MNSNNSTIAYRDYASINEEDLELAGWKAAEIKSPTFAERMHYLLSEMEKDGHQEIASWQPHGRAFIVHKRTEFEKDHLPL